MERLPEIKIGDDIRFLTCTVTIRDFAYIPGFEGIQEKYVLFVERDDLITPYVVMDLTPRGWAFREWDNGQYYADSHTAQGRFKVRRRLETGR